MNMDVTVVLMSFLLQGLLEAGALVATGEEGKELIIKCVHSNAVSNVKYFCDRACRDEDVLVTSNTPDTDGKYRIEDEGNTFYVTVSKLTAADEGIYWCGIQRVGVDTYNRVDVRVTQRTLLYTGAGLGVVLLALAIVLLFFRHRKRLISSSQEKDDSAVYETPSKQKLDRHRDAAAASASRRQETCGTTDHIYLNDSSQPQNQPEALFYSSVSFNKHSGCGAVTPAASSATYTSIKDSATVEPTIYSSV